MSAFVFFSVLCAALLHASWNALIKVGGDKAASMALLTIGHSLFSLPLLFLAPLPAPEVWPWIVASGVIHAAYQVALLLALEQGDLSRVYPISRGTAPLIVALVSALFLADRLSAVEALGVLVLGLGILTMARGALRSGESRRLIPYALIAATATAGYTLVDGLGARVMGAPLAFTGWILICTAVCTLPSIYLMRGSAPFRAVTGLGPRGLLAPAASVASYAIAVWAMTQAPIALVAALRETSILFAVLIGWLLLGDRMDRAKALAAGLILLGAALTRL